MRKDFPAREYKKRRLPYLSTNEKIEIIHAAMIEKKHHDFIARHYRISRSTISLLVKKVKANPDYVQGLLTVDESHHKIQK